MFQAAKAKADALKKAAEEAKGVVTEIVPYGPHGSRNNVLKIWGKDNAKSPKVIAAAQGIINTWDFDDPKSIAALRFVAYDEWLKVIEEEGEYTCAALLQAMAGQVAKQAMLNAAMYRKHKAAEKRLQEVALNAQAG
jgi:hypothetical protein